MTIAYFVVCLLVGVFLFFGFDVSNCVLLWVNVFLYLSILPIIFFRSSSYYWFGHKVIAQHSTAFDITRASEIFIACLQFALFSICYAQFRFLLELVILDKSFSHMNWDIWSKSMTLIQYATRMNHTHESHKRVGTIQKPIAWNCLLQFINNVAVVALAKSQQITFRFFEHKFIYATVRTYIDSNKC